MDSMTLDCLRSYELMQEMSTNLHLQQAGNWRASFHVVADNMQMWCLKVEGSGCKACPLTSGRNRCQA